MSELAPILTNVTIQSLSVVSFEESQLDVFRRRQSLWLMLQVLPVGRCIVPNKKREERGWIVQTISTIHTYAKRGEET